MAQKFTVPITVKQLTSASSDAVTVYVDADTYARLKVEAGGRLVWGSRRKLPYDLLCEYVSMCLHHLL